MKKHFGKEQGITLIALVITIIILLFKQIKLKKSTFSKFRKYFLSIILRKIILFFLLWSNIIN